MTEVVELVSYEAKKTEAIGEKLGRSLKGGEFIELAGDIGAGKTTLIRGIVRGAGSKDQVTSPTFVLENLYKGRVNIRHLDLYRLNEPGLIAREINEAIDGKENVVITEWAGQFKNLLPDERAKIEINVKGDNDREIRIQITKNLSYLEAGLQ